MKKLSMSSILLAALVIVMSAAAKTDYDHAADFGRYETYSWLKVEAENSLWQDRIRNAVDAQLSAKGWRNVATGGDVALAAVGSIKTEQQLDTFYNGFGGGWYWRGFGYGIATTNVEHIPVGSLVLDMLDAKTKKLLWRARAEKVLSGDPEKNEKKLRDIVADMFKNFPPMSKG